MADERLRGGDDSPLSTSVPDAPVPLARSVLERFRYGAKKAAAQVSSSPEGVSRDTVHLTAQYGPTFSQTINHRAGLKIRALDINQFRTHVVLAGGKLLKTVKVDSEPNCIEDFNLHTVAVNYAGGSSSLSATSHAKSRHKAHDSHSVQRDMFDIEDVAWSNNEFRDYIATAARNGKIMLYDMNRPGVEVGSLHEHYRQVHKVDFNPLEGAFLLSGSQDGTVRLWDLRSYRKSAVICASMDTFAGRSEGVRHVKWSPRDTWSFAFGTDNGVIQRWDIRNNKKPILKFSAHHETCNSIDWHPDGRHLVSAGKDRIVKVWDIAPDAKGKASFHVRTPHEVQNVRWRPPCFVMDPTEYQTIKQCTHFATSYRTYPVVQVWDLRRPHMPFREIFHRFNSGTTDMLWRCKDLLWTVGAEGEFNQTDVPFEPKTIDRRPLVSVSCGSGGQVTFLSQSRTCPASRRWTSSDKPKPKRIGKSALKRESLPFGRSPGDDSFDEQFLGSTYRRGHSRAASLKSAKQLGATPPSTDEMTRMVTTDLKTIMDIYENFKPSQSARIGYLPGTLQSELFIYLHQNYKTPRNPRDYDLSYLESIDSLFEQNAGFAQRASLYRDAQMWRILGLQLSKDLKQRQKANRVARLKGKGDIARNSRDMASFEQMNMGSPAVRGHGKAFSAQRTSALFLAENSSNAPTPVVRAMEKQLNQTNPLQIMSEDIQLPPSLESKFRTDSMAFSSDTGSERESLSPGRAGAKNGLAAQFPQDDVSATTNPLMSRAPYTLDVLPGPTQGIEVPGQSARRNSSESFWMFSTSSESPDYRLNEDSFPSNSSRNVDQATTRPSEEAFNFQSSIRSAGSTQTNSSSEFASQENHLPKFMGNRESFLDLPTHGNLRVDDFVDTKSKSTQLNEGKTNPKISPVNGPSNFNSSVEKSPPAKRPQYRLAEQYEPLKERQKISPAITKAQSRPKGNASSIVPSGASTIPSKQQNKGIVPNETVEDSILSDYLLTNEAQQTFDETKSAIISREMIPELLQWYASKGDSLTAAHIFLYTVPLLGDPKTWLSNSPEAHKIAHFHDSLGSPDILAGDQTISTLKAQQNTLNSLGISMEFAESILSTYHDELVSRELLDSATSFRKLAYPSFPAVYEQALKDVQIHLLCLGCSSPINNPRNKMYCESCRKRQEDCAICWCAQSPFDWDLDAPLRSKIGRHLARKKAITPVNLSREASSLWATCTVCNHSTHVACAEHWFADTESENNGSGGACPVPNCLCDCVSGWYRNERLAKLEAKEKQKRLTTPSIAMGGGVRKDKWTVTESRAVGKVRGALRDSKAPSALSGDHGSASSERPKLLYRANSSEQGRTMSDEAKRVRLVAPDDHDSSYA